MIYQDDRYMKFQASHEEADIIQAGGMPLLLKNGRAFTSNNSYGGPLNNGFSYEQFIEELKRAGAFSYKIRFSPWLENHKYFPVDKVKHSRQTVARNLYVQKRDSLLKEFNHGTKWAIKHSGVEVHYYRPDETHEATFKAFHDLYIKSMKRVRAEQCYFYSLEYFTKQLDCLYGNIDYFEAEEMAGENTIGGAFFLTDENNCYYYFSGFDKSSEFKDCHPMDDILFEAIWHYGYIGKKLMFFGGGLQDGDSLFQFKRKFGNMILNYYIAEGEV